MAVIIILLIYGYLALVIVGFVMVWTRNFWDWLRAGSGPSPARRQIVEKAKRERLTAEERERRFRTIYPRGWVQRARWPVSRDS